MKKNIEKNLVDLLLILCLLTLYIWIVLHKSPILCNYIVPTFASSLHIKVVLIWRASSHISSSLLVRCVLDKSALLHSFLTHTKKRWDKCAKWANAIELIEQRVLHVCAVYVAIKLFFYVMPLLLLLLHFVVVIVFLVAVIVFRCDLPCQKSIWDFSNWFRRLKLFCAMKSVGLHCIAIYNLSNLVSI